MVKILSYGIPLGIFFSLIFAYQPGIFSMEEKKRKFGHDDEKIENAINFSRVFFNKARKTLQLHFLNDLPFLNQVMQETDDKGTSLLHTFAYLGQLEEVKYLAKNGADIKKKNNDGEKPIISAAQGGHIDVVEFLFEKGGYDKMFDERKFLLPLVKIADERAVAFFKKHFGGLKWPKLIIHTVKGGGHLGFLEFFLEQQQERSIPGIRLRSETILESEKHKSILTASKNGHSNHLKKLIEHEFSICVTNRHNFSPLWLAAYNGHISCIEVLMKAGASLNRDKINDTKNNEMDDTDDIHKIDLPFYMVHCSMVNMLP